MHEQTVIPLPPCSSTVLDTLFITYAACVLSLSGVYIGRWAYDQIKVRPAEHVICARSVKDGQSMRSRRACALPSGTEEYRYQFVSDIHRKFESVKHSPKVSNKAVWLLRSPPAGHLLRNPEDGCNDIEDAWLLGCLINLLG